MRPPSLCGPDQAVGARARAHGDISEPIGLLGELLEGGSMTRISDINGLRPGGAVSRAALFLAVSFVVLLAGCSDKGERETSNDTANVAPPPARSEEHTSELQSLMRISYAVFCLKKKNKRNIQK